MTLTLCHYSKFTVLTDDSVIHVIVAINVISLLIAAPGNIITIAVIARVRKLRKEATYLLIGSVCMADTMVAIITQPLYISTLILQSSDSYCNLYLIFYVFGWISSFGSVVGINMITLDRFLYIAYPMHYYSYMTRKRAILLIILTWVIALLFATIPLGWHNTITQHSILFCHNSVSCILVGITYYRIYKKVRLSNSQKPFGRCDSLKEELAMQRQATRTVCLIVILFVACWGPWTIISFMMAIKENIVDDIGAAYQEKTFKIVHSFSLSFGFTGSACNVLIYTFKNKLLREEWIKFICQRFRRERQSTLPLKGRSERCKNLGEHVHSLAQTLQQHGVQATST